MPSSQIRSINPETLFCSQAVPKLESHSWATAAPSIEAASRASAGAWMGRAPST